MSSSREAIMSITQTQADPTPRVMDDYEWTEIDFTALVTDTGGTVTVKRARKIVAAILIPKATAGPSAPTAAVGAATGLTGAYQYKVTFVNAAGETIGGATSNAVTVANQKINLSSIPLGPAGTTARNIYRTKAGGGDGSSFFFQSQIADNTTTTLTGDATADASLGSPVPNIFAEPAVTWPNSAPFGNTLTLNWTPQGAIGSASLLVLFVPAA
jgi:hypothetical protein